MKKAISVSMFLVLAAALIFSACNSSQDQQKEANSTQGKPVTNNPESEKSENAAVNTSPMQYDTTVKKTGERKKKERKRKESKEEESEEDEQKEKNEKSN